MKRFLVLPAMALALSLSSPLTVHAEGNDYPTAERVQFVEECMADYPDKGRFEMVHKCSCVIDQLAAHYTLDEYVDMTTAAKAFTISGERGNVVRDTPMGKRLNTQYKQAIAASKDACFLK